MQGLGEFDKMKGYKPVKYGKKRKIIVNKRTKEMVEEVDDHVTIFHSENTDSLMIAHNGNLTCKCKICEGISKLFGFK